MRDVQLDQNPSHSFIKGKVEFLININEPAYRISNAFQEYSNIKVERVDEAAKPKDGALIPIP